ncbi:hypothetical protein Tco_0727834 [Tanacetum coccineum]|uniref:Uncharacterized protein n=1 Tax=Tanacetum coccineum TaxID=301880 RepID=A0ABQ4YJI3_9ASTR
MKNRGDMEYALDKKNTSMQMDHLDDIQFFSLCVKEGGNGKVAWRIWNSEMLVTLFVLKIPTAKGVGLRMADSHTGNHPKDGFMLLKTIRSSLLLEIFFAKELNEFLSSYPIPSEYDVILPTSTQTIFDAPPGFFNLCRASSWLTFQKRSKKHILNLLPKVITRIEGWHERFFFVQDSIISSKYPQLLLDENRLNLKSFKDKLPPNIDENPYFQRLGRYPTSIRVFDDIILFLAGLKPSWEFGQQWPAIIMAFRNFIYTKDDDDNAFLPKEPSLGFGTGSPSASVNTELRKDAEEPECSCRIKERKCKTRGGSSRSPMKRKLASGSSSSHDVRAKTSASKDDAPILSISDDD